MKIAITEWNERIAPVFDVANQAIIIELKNNCMVCEEKVALPDGCSLYKILFLHRLGVQWLICGAISHEAQMEAKSADIKVSGFIAGNYHEIIEAWQNGIQLLVRYAMPGCGRLKRCRKRR